MIINKALILNNNLVIIFKYEYVFAEIIFGFFKLNFILNAES